MLKTKAGKNNKIKYKTENLSWPSFKLCRDILTKKLIIKKETVYEPKTEDEKTSAKNPEIIARYITSAPK